MIAGELTDLTSPVVSTALKIRQDGGMGVATQDELQDLSRQWGDKANQLKEAVDEIINPLDFTAATGEDYRESHTHIEVRGDYYMHSGAYEQQKRAGRE